MSQVQPSGSSTRLPSGDEITRRLTEPAFQKLLAAHTAIYDRARWWHRGRVTLGAALAVSAPIVVLYYQDLRVALGAAATVGIVAVLILDNLERRLTELGAKVMEEFDTRLFSVRWNDLLVGEHPRAEQISAADRRFHGNRHQQAVDWYPDVKDIPPIYAQLVIQRCTAVWDQRQRLNYALLVLGVTVLTFIGGIALASLRSMSLTDYLLSIGLPSMLAYVQGVGVVIEQFQIAGRRDGLCQGIESLMNEALEAGLPPHSESVRDAQNILFITRVRPGGVPKFVFRFLKRGLDADQQAAADEWRVRIRMKVSASA